MKRQSIIIIGGGVMGICSAYYLHREGHQVTVVERSREPQGCSYGNCGMIVPSHFTPLASPGIIRKGLSWMLNPESPFYIRPRMDSSLLNWGLTFYRKANQKHVDQTSGIIRNLNLDSRELYRELFETELTDLDINLKGLVMYCQTEKALGEEIKMAETAQSLGLKVDILDPEKIKALEPLMEMNVVGGVHYLDDGFIHPENFLERLKAKLKSKGVSFLMDREVTDFEIENNQITSIGVGSETRSADQYVVTAGAWSGRLAKKLQVNMPMQGGKGYGFFLPQEDTKLKTCCILVESKIAVTPYSNGIQFGGTMEIVGTDESINHRRVMGIKKAIPRYFPQFKASDFDNLHIWNGLRPVSADGLPYIGRLTKLSNVVMATGHGMMGMSMGPVTGKMVSDIVDDRNTGFEMKSLAPERYHS